MRIFWIEGVLAQREFKNYEISIKSTLFKISITTGSFSVSRFHNESVFVFHNALLFGPSRVSW
ncbi:MAG: hypothetical protein HCAMLNBO_01417 [Candidatus Brocadia fulgida]|nr:hypothetical protein [Candidatus Brocadia fulgida]